MRKISALLLFWLHRFTCQLAITDINYAELEGAAAGSSHHHHHHHHQADMSCVPTRRRNLGVGLAVNFHSSKKSPLKRVNELRHQMVQDEGHALFEIQEEHMSDTESVGSFQGIRRRSSGGSGVERALSSGSVCLDHVAESSEASGTVADREPQEFSHMHYDTFENCLHMADQSDSLLSFYYTEENNPNVVKVTEIFPINEDEHNQHPPPPEPEPKMDPASDLAWDNFLEMKWESPEDAGVSGERRAKPGLRRCMSDLSSVGMKEVGWSETEPGLGCIREEVSSSFSSEEGCGVITSAPS